MNTEKEHNETGNDAETGDESLEQLILQESIVSAAGLNSEQVLIGIKGDPSLRESAPLRKRYDSKVDSLFDKLEPNLEHIMLNCGMYRIFVGFNSGEIRTNSVFDPLRQEIHDAEKIADTEYIKRHFPQIEYDDKIALMRELYATLRASEHYRKIPTYWQNILNRRSEHWRRWNRRTSPRYSPRSTNCVASKSIICVTLRSVSYRGSSGCSSTVMVHRSSMPTTSKASWKKTSS